MSYKQFLSKCLRLSRLDLLSIKGVSARGTNTTRVKYSRLEDLLENHFNQLSDPDHPCRSTIGEALKKLSNKSSLIIETGSSAWGTNSSLLFDSYVNSFGGNFETVDLRIEPLINLRAKCSPHTFLHCNDSIDFLKKWSLKNPSQKIDLLYLDSWDVMWKNPDPSGIHGLAEFLAVSDNLQKGSMLLIDDTPKDESFFLSSNYVSSFSDYFSTNGFYPGKGSLVKQLLISLGRGREVMHKYQLLWEF